MLSERMKSSSLRFDIGAVVSRMVIICVAFIAAIITTAASDTPEILTGDESSCIRAEAMAADSIARVRAAELADTAGSFYKRLKFVQYDGVTESELYPLVMSTYKATLEALGQEKLENADKERMNGILVDIQDLLRKGAFYYSSQQDQNRLVEMATAYVDIRMNPELKKRSGVNDTQMYPAMVYIAASGAYNGERYEDAIRYFDEYLRTDAVDKRESVAVFMGQACLKTGQPERCVNQLIAAVNRYPVNDQLLRVTLQNCLDGGYTDLMQPLLDKALALRPEDEQLLTVQARLYENESNFKQALDIYTQLDMLRPNSLSITRHLALCYYNLGADYYNRSIMEADEKASKKFHRQSQAYFGTAADKLAQVVANDPSDVKYLKALAITYGCTGDQAHLEEVNQTLRALGVSAMAMNSMPETIVYDSSAAAGKKAEVPDFQQFARNYVEKNLADFTRRGEFERSEDYEKRMTQENVYAEYQRLCKVAESDYLDTYGRRLRINDMRLQPYDVDNESYLIESDMGPVVVKVPLKNKEAEAFKSSWNTIQIRNPRFYIHDNRVAIASVDLVTPTGKTYSYNAASAASYDFTEVRVDIATFLNKGASDRDNKAMAFAQPSRRQNNVIRAKSDVDENIPVTSRKSEKTVAVIMANENYKRVSTVESALNDGETFARYCEKTLGIPEAQVMLYEDLTYAEMLSAVEKLRQLCGALGEGVDVIFYYAGHGVPDEATRDAFLLPVDGDGITTAASYSLKKLYADLAGAGAENVMVFLDACFSGATREGDMLAKARGVALKPKMAGPEGNMYVLSAASDQETAMPYKAKNHGLFTYYLLKKLQESKGNATLRELSEYVEENVKKNSMLVNKKLQSPRTTLSGTMHSEWERKKLRP